MRRKLVLCGTMFWPFLRRLCQIFFELFKNSGSSLLCRDFETIKHVLSITRRIRFFEIHANLVIWCRSKIPQLFRWLFRRLSRVSQFRQGQLSSCRNKSSNPRKNNITSLELSKFRRNSVHSVSNVCIAVTYYFADCRIVLPRFRSIFRQLQQDFRSYASSKHFEYSCQL